MNENLAAVIALFVVFVLPVMVVLVLDHLTLYGVPWKAYERDN